jgi:hypothetical protein
MPRATKDGKFEGEKYDEHSRGETTTTTKKTNWKMGNGRMDYGDT